MNTKDKIAHMAKMMQAYVDGEIVENFVYGEWVTVGEDCAWRLDFEYRIKPNLKDIWVNEYDGDYGAHETREDAESHACNDVIRTAVHYREVLEDE